MRRNSRVVLLLLTVAAICGALIYFAFEVRRELIDIRSAPQDNLHWTLSQLEVDLLVLNAASLEAIEKESAGLAEFRRRFDTFYSRVDTLNNSDFLRSVEAGDDIRDRVDRILGLLQSNISLVDGDDDELLRSLREMSRMFVALRPEVRAISLEGISVYATLSDKRRAAFSLLLLQTAALAAMLIVALAASLFFLFRQYRISVRKTVEIERASGLLKHTIDASLDAIIVTDGNGHIVEYNPSASKIFGYARSEAISNDIAELLISRGSWRTERPGIERLISSIRIAAGERVETQAKHKDGSVFPIEVSVRTAVGNSGPIYIAYIRDISRRLEAEKAIVDARDRALAADKSKSDFLAVMSHEMRTPLNGMIGVLQLLHDTPLSEEQNHLIELAETSSEILVRHVNDVLDIAKIEAGRLEFFQQPFDLEEIIDATVKLNTPNAENQGTVIAVDLDTCPERRFLGDPTRVSQILLNLVGNAVKFCDHGEVDIICREINRTGDELTIELVVEDTGIGIDPEDQERIFDDFVTLDSSYGRRANGTGLGLGITRRLVAAMNGRIDLVSSRQHGSRFSVQLPLRLAPALSAVGEVGEAKTEISSGLSVLVVEDNDTNRLIVSRMLETQGCTVVPASDGQAGVELAFKRRFDLILMDISMPGMDGLQACHAIRSAGGLSAETPIVGLTAHALLGDEERHRAVGLSDCLTKPLRREKLAEILSRIKPGVATGGSAMPIVRPVDASNTDHELIDTETFLELAEILPKNVLQQKVNAFGDELERGLGAISTALENDDRQTAAAIAHKLLGTAAFMGASQLECELRGIEDKAAFDHVGALRDECAKMNSLSLLTISSFTRLLG